VGSRWRREALRRRLLALADLAAAATATVAVASTSTGELWVLLAIPLWILVAKLLGLYDRDQRTLRHLTVDELPAIAVWAAVSTVLVALALLLTPVESLTIGAVFALFGVALVLGVLFRGTARLAWWRFTPPELTAVIGSGHEAQVIRRQVELFRDMHFELTGEIDPEALVEGGGANRQIEALTERVDRLIVASSAVDEDLIAALAIVCRKQQVKLSVVLPPRPGSLPASRFSRVGDLPVWDYTTWDVSRSTMLLKRLFDLSGSLVGLVALAPLLPLIALAIKLETPGPVILSQVRAGRRGRPFRMYKFRTMVADAEERLSSLVAIDELREPVFKLRGDPRVTRVGRVLRRLSFDEAPQLFNVLRGEMSIVGPRPEQVDLVERYRPEHRLRLDVKPGITGPMQIHGRGDLEFSERLAVELDYIGNLSLPRDGRILLLTVFAIVRGNGAY
jgi:exopolysaccharide biosynthesis polyprenyl glycosylphosphotransferase